MVEIAMLSNLTIIVPTYNRQLFALRTMRYWSNFAATLHVLDGSSKSICNSDLECFSSNINYHHLPISLVKRLEIGASIPTTKYAMLLGDDEFFIPSGLEACIAEIENDKELVSCMGRSISFINKKGEVIGWPSSIEMKGYQIQQNDPIERMVFHMNPYTCSTIYSVVRTPVWKIAISPIIKNDFNIQSIQELQFELGVCYMGKAKVIETLMWLRSHENQPIRKTEPILMSFPDWWHSKIYKKEQDELIRITGQIFANGNTDETKQACDGVKKALDAYVAQYNTGKVNEVKHTSITSNIYNNIKRFIPRVIKENLKKYYYQLSKNKYTQHKNIIEVAKDMNNCGVDVDFKQLLQIKNAILNFHANEGSIR